MKINRAALIAVGVLAACSATDQIGCTLLACLGTLTLVVSPAPSGPYHIELLSVTEGQRTFDCADPSGKCADAKFVNYAPDQMVITITNANGSKQYNLAPNYTDTYPNGPNCGAGCRSATVTLALP